jgi:hypothetical protein
MRRSCRALVVPLTLLSLAGCSSASPPTVRPAPGASAGATTEALTALNPCDPAWQLPTWAREDPVADPTFRAFEDRLYAGSSLWVGSFSLPYPYRAIVEVDVYARGSKKLVSSALWYLADIPITSTDALAAVSDFAEKPPVDSFKLGFCLTDNSFLPAGDPVPQGQKIVFEVAEYDPRCVCEPPDGVISISE